MPLALNCNVVAVLSTTGDPEIGTLVPTLLNVTAGAGSLAIW